MTFPLYINLGIVNIHPHVFFEMLGWIAGLSLMFFLRREKDDFTIEQRSWLILAAVVGALFGAKSFRVSKTILESRNDFGVQNDTIEKDCLVRKSIPKHHVCDMLYNYIPIHFP